MVNVPEEGTGGGGLNDDDEILDPPRLVLLIYEASSLLPKRLSLVFDSLLPLVVPGTRDSLDLVFDTRSRNP